MLVSYYLFILLQFYFEVFIIINLSNILFTILKYSKYIVSRNRVKIKYSFLFSKEG